MSHFVMHISISVTSRCLLDCLWLVEVKKFFEIQKRSYFRKILVFTFYMLDKCFREVSAEVDVVFCVYFRI